MHIPVFTVDPVAIAEEAANFLRQGHGTMLASGTPYGYNQV